MQERQHVTKNSNHNPSNSTRKSILARTAITQIKTDSNASLTQQDIETQQYQKERFEATKLEVQAKYGTITPLGQERLTLLQAKKAEFWQRDLGNTKRNSRDFSMIPVHRKEVLPIQAIQAKFIIGAPGDKYEQEADRIAAQVVNQINAPVAQQESQNLQHKTQAVEIQKRPWLRFQAKHDSMAAPAELESSIQQAKSGGQPLADNTRQPMEQAFGTDFSGVKVHTDTKADQLSQSIQAKAFTTGQDVFFRQGEYNPGSRGGQELIAHELTHVVQQNGGAVQMLRDKQIEVQNPSTYTPYITGGKARSTESIQKFVQRRGATENYKKEDVYNLNQYDWGVCGFVAAYQAAISKEQERTHPGERIDKELILDMVLRFNDHLNKKQRRSEIWQKILKFSKSFTNPETTYDYGAFEDALDLMIEDIQRSDLTNQEDAIDLDTDEEEMGEENVTQSVGIGLAMPPQAMILLLESEGITADPIENKDFPTVSKVPNNTIIGLGNSAKTQGEHQGLLHWVFKNEEGKVMSWGHLLSNPEESLKKQGYDRVIQYLKIKE